MQLKPVKKYKAPDYPIKEYFEKNSALLNKYMPRRWKGKAFVAIAFSLFAINGCASNIAPIFIHGEGLGSIGCIVVSPPIFISEETARQVIIKELKKENISFDKKDVSINAIINNEYKLVLDGLDTKNNLGYEFISKDDAYSISPKHGSYSSVTDYNTKAAAENIRRKLQEYDKIKVVVFYDPIIYKRTRIFSPKMHDEVEQQALNESKELLRLQVKDFIAWMKKTNFLDKKDSK